MIIYCYDLKMKNKKSYNALKRRFYYQLKNSKISTMLWKTKSVLAVPRKLEKEADGFFRRWRGSIVVYKIHPKEAYEFL